jgi:SAM-dependent methyltransferase
MEREPSPVSAYSSVDDVPYVRGFVREAAPAWLDHVALLWGFAPPDRSGGFTWCDLGCGNGVTAALLAATHPSGTFHAIDALASHIDDARQLAAAARVGNVTYHAAAFDAAAALDLPQFDYVTAHGVYTWIDAKARADLRRLIDRHLKPGGLLYLSYNALPGRAADIPFQNLMQELGRRHNGDSAERAKWAYDAIRRMRKLNLPGFASSPMANALYAEKTPQNPFYLAHEFMVPDWQPLSVVQMRQDMRGIGLKPLGSARLVENFDTYTLRDAERRFLKSIADPDLAALLRDHFVNQSFRRDVFMRDGQPVSNAARRNRLLSSSFALTRPAPQVDYKFVTSAGQIAFDNPTTRSIVATLANGPRPLAELRTGDMDPDRLLSHAMVLSAAQQIAPVEPGRSPVATFNAVVLDRLGGPDELRCLALNCGTGVKAAPELLKRMRMGARLTGKQWGAWNEYLAIHAT